MVSSTGPSRRVGAVVWSTLLLAATCLIVLVVFDLDFSAARDFRSDVLVRDANAGRLQPYRFSDASPFQLWLPSDLFVWRSVRSGSLPLWNRLQGGGYSPLLSFQNGVLHPVRLALAFFPRAQAASALIVIAETASFLGMFLLLTAGYGLPAYAALLGAAVYAFSGNMTSVLFFSGSLLPFAHLPWIVLFGIRWQESADRRMPWALIASFALLILSGHFASVFVVAVSAGLALLICGSKRVRFAGVLLAAIAIDAFALLPVALNVPDLWSYKTRTPLGMSYELLSGADWLESVKALFFDTHIRANHLDYRTVYYFIGAVAVFLAFLGMMVARDRARFVWAAVPAGFLVAFAGPWMGFLQHVPILRMFKPWYLLTIFVFGVAVAAAIGATAVDRLNLGRLRIPLLAALFAGTVAPYVPRMVEAIPVSRAQPFGTGAAFRFLAKQPKPGRVTGLFGQTHLANSSELTTIEDLRIASPMLSRRYHAWCELAAPGVEHRSFPTNLIPDRTQSPLLGQFNAGFILQSRLPNLPMYTLIDEPDPRHHDARYKVDAPLHDDLLPLVFEDHSIRIYENRRALAPRAELAQRAVSVDPTLEGAVGWLREHADEAERPVVVESSNPLPQRLGSGSAVVSYPPQDGRVVIDVTASANALLVLHDTFARGWSAEIDGRQAAVLPVDVLSRGVLVPQGRHRVVMAYWPPGMTIGLWISALTIVALVVLARRSASRT